MEQHITSKTVNTQPAWVGLIRIALGFLLVWKGLAFIHDTSQLQTMMERAGVDNFSGLANTTAAIVGIVTLLSGIFMSVGLFTRTIAFFQVFVVGIALVFLSVTNIERNIVDVASTFIVISLLLFYGLHGGGSLSFDRGLLHERGAKD